MRETKKQLVIEYLIIAVGSAILLRVSNSLFEKIFYAIIGGVYFWLYFYNKYYKK